MEEHRSIETDAHSQVASVCENSSLTPQQKQQQVREIRQQVQQKMDALITPSSRALCILASSREPEMVTKWRTSSRRRGTVREFRGSAGRQGSSNGRAAGSNPQPPAAARRTDEQIP